MRDLCAATEPFTAAALERSALLAEAAENILRVLRELHPHNANLTAAHRLSLDFEDEIGTAARAARLEPMLTTATPVDSAPVPVPAASDILDDIPL